MYVPRNGFGFEILRTHAQFRIFLKRKNRWSRVINIIGNTINTYT